ncbi:MAG TPA: glycosyltransferase family 4 protein [Chloroflexota bacterium]|nr:glycosyltransferase family 4 protein [Chloroflexota bacterium]
MKIGLVSPYDLAHPGGVTEHVAHLAAEFQRADHEVHVIAPSSRAEPVVEGAARVHAIGRAVPVPANGSVARISLSLTLARSVKRLLDEERFDVLHLHEPLMPALPLTVLRFSRALNVGTFHAFRQSNISAYFYGRSVLRYFVRRLHGRIAVSHCARDFVAEYFPGDYRIIPNGIDLARFSAPQEPLQRYRDGKLNVLFVGRLEQRKGVSHLLRAWRYVRREMPAARLIVVGDGRPLDGYVRFAETHGMREVVFTGYVSPEELLRYYHTCDVFCAPSTGQESFGIVLLEAMAAGKPIVASAIPGYQEVVRHGQEGLLVEPRDEVALALSLVHLLADSALRARLAAAGRQRVVQFAWDRIASGVLAYYEEVRAEQAQLSTTRRPRLQRMRRAGAWVARRLAP